MNKCIWILNLEYCIFYTIYTWSFYFSCVDVTLSFLRMYVIYSYIFIRIVSETLRWSCNCPSNSKYDGKIYWQDRPALLFLERSVHAVSIEQDCGYAEWNSHIVFHPLQWQWWCRGKLDQYCCQQSCQTSITLGSLIKWKKNSENTFWFLDPAPLGLPTKGRCFGYDNEFRLTTGSSCSTKFTYDGTFLREYVTSRVICPENTVSGSSVYLLMSCAYSVDFEYARKGGSTVCLVTTRLCLAITSSTPGTAVTLRDEQPSLVTYIYKGTVIKNLRNMWLGDIRIADCCKIVVTLVISDNHCQRTHTHTHINMYTWI